MIRDALHNLIQLLFPGNKNILPRLERLFSLQFSSQIGVAPENDPRRPIFHDEIDIAHQLNQWTVAVQNIPDVLSNEFMPIYSAFIDPRRMEPQMELSKNAIYRAQELLFIHKHENQGKLPKVVLKNLRPETEPNRNSRHVVIAISGWLSEKGDKAFEWSQLTEHLQDSQVGLFALEWPS